MTTHTTSTKLQLGSLIAFSCVLYFPLVYKNTTGENDSMRMIINIIQSLKDDVSFYGYNYNISFAYYYLLELFRDYFIESYENLFIVMNYLSVCFAVFAQVPLYFIVKRYWDSKIAILTCVVFATMPVWWNLSLYGHPMIPSTALFLAGLSLYTTNIFQNKNLSAYKAGLLVLSILIFSASLSFRLDTILLFPLLTAIFILNRESIYYSFAKSILIGICSLAIFIFLQNTYGAIQAESGLSGFSSVLERMADYHNLSRFLDSMKKGLISFSFAMGHVYLLLFSAGVIFLAIKKDYKSLFFLLPVSIINLIFWLPNPTPVRHFVYVAPIIAFGCSLFVFQFGSRYIKITNAKTIILCFFVLFVSVLSSELLFPLAKAHYPWNYKAQDFSWRIPIRSTPISKRNIEEHFYASKITSQCLVKELDNIPNIIVGESLPLIMYIQMLSEDNIKFSEYATANRTVFFKVRLGESTFYIPDMQGDRISDYIADINEYFKNGQYSLMVDRNNHVTGSVNYSFADNITVLNHCGSSTPNI
jgi:hypothetical protein